MIPPEVSIYLVMVGLLPLTSELSGRLRSPYPYLRPVCPGKTQVPSSSARV